MTHPGIETIQTTLGYFRLHGIKTRVLGSGFRSVSTHSSAIHGTNLKAPELQLSEIGLLGDFDGICVTKAQIDRLKWSQIVISTPDDSSSSALRARQAQYPTSFLESGVGFMNVMSAETRTMVAATMFVALGEMKAHMNVLQKIVEKEVTRQFELQTFDLATLYNSPRARREITQTSADCVAPRRNILEAFRSDDTPLGDDEVF